MQSTPQSRCDFDVIVVGGGPAGCAAAAALHRQGNRIALWTKPAAPRCFSQILSAEAKMLLEWELGVELNSTLGVPLSGIESVWGSDEPYAQDSIFNPYGDGLHVNRSLLDAAIVNRVASLGVLVDTNAAVVDVRRVHDGIALAANTATSGTVEAVARFVIDATGRVCRIARKLGAKRIHANRQVALYRVRPLSAPLPHARLRIQSTPHGWWYLAPLPPDDLCAVFLTDWDLVPSGWKSRREYWKRESQYAQWLFTQSTGFEDSAELRISDASTSWIAPYDVREVVCVGDAQLAIDPLSGAGMKRALESGQLAAEAIGAALGGNLEKLCQYDDWNIQQRIAILQATRSVFRREPRWNEEVFWQRRHLVAPPVAPTPGS